MDIKFEELPVNPRGGPQGGGLTHVSNEILEGRDVPASHCDFSRPSIAESPDGAIGGPS